MNKYNIILLILIVVVAGIGVVMFMNQPSEPGQVVLVENEGEKTILRNSDKEPEVITSEIDTTNWQTYRNEELRFEFRYPNGWGEPERRRETQIRVYSHPQNLGDDKLLINISDDKENFEDIDELAKITVSNACYASLSKNILLKNNKFLDIRISDPQEWLSQEECFKLYESFPDSRKVIFNNTGSEGVGRILLKEDEIPQEIDVDYELFKKVVDSFSVY